jgi:hypothetical protein
MIRTTFGELVEALHDNALARYGDEHLADEQAARAIGLVLALNVNAETLSVLAELTKLDGGSITVYASLGWPGPFID